METVLIQMMYLKYFCLLPVAWHTLVALPMEEEMLAIIGHLVHIVAVLFF